MKAIGTTIVDLRRLVSPVLPLADSGTKYLPSVWGAIRIRSHEGYLTADATDRFVAGVSRRPAPGVGSGFDELIRAEDLRLVLRTIKPGPSPDVAIHIYPADANGEIVIEARESRHMTSTVFRFRSLGGTTPVDLWELLDKSLRTEGTDMAFGVNPEKLAVFAAATNHDVNEGNLPLIMRSPRNGKGAMVVACGDHFLGLLMPMLTVPEANDEILSQWLSLIAPMKRKSDAAPSGPRPSKEAMA